MYVSMQTHYLEPKGKITGNMVEQSLVKAI